MLELIVNIQQRKMDTNDLWRLIGGIKMILKFNITISLTHS